MRVDDILQDFLNEAEDRFQVLETQLISLESKPDDAQALAEVFRAAHSLKGTCGFLGFVRLGRLAHTAEDLMAQARAGMHLAPDHIQLLLGVLDAMRGIVFEIERAGEEPAAAPEDEIALCATLETAAAGLHFTLPAVRGGTHAGLQRSMLRVQSDVFDNLLAISGEIALALQRDKDISARQRDKLAAEASAAHAGHLALLTQKMQAEVLRGRLQPVMEAWRSLPRLVRDLAAGAGLSVRLQTEGSDTLLDRQVLDVIRDPIAHLVRNCLSHGLEPPADREAQGKAAEGVIQLSAAAAEGQVVITISDDGRGIDLDAVRAKALSSGMVTPAQLAAMSETQVAALVFARHFSTAAQVDDLAGRGVGLDAAVADLAAIGGSLTVEAPVPGRGAVFVMRVPLTLAMLPAAVVRAGGQRFVLPRLSILRFCRLPEKYDTAGGMPVLQWQGMHIPLLFMPQALELPQAAGQQAKDSGHDGGFAVIVQAGGMTAAVAIEEMIWTGDVIVKPLPPMLQACGVYLGLTLLPDGAPAMIVDVRRMMQRCGVDVKPQTPAIPVTAQAETERILVFDQDGLCAVPVSCVDAARRAVPTDFHTAHDGVLYYASGEDMLPVVQV
ncbi:MAG: Hpt domain-containing protein, partial [Bdellovibrionales bacterium]|nr:Hpt domain-containing protein [Bdellovibrionales bacterium]